MGSGGEGIGVVMGGRARGWLPDVAAIMWRRMLAALGDPNLLRDPHAHANLYNYLIHLNTTLLKVGISPLLTNLVLIIPITFNISTIYDHTTGRIFRPGEVIMRGGPRATIVFRKLFI